MGSIISKIADEIALHGSYEAYCAFRDKEEATFFIPLEESKRNGEVKKVHYIYPHDVEKLKTGSDIYPVGNI